MVQSLAQCLQNNLKCVKQDSLMFQVIGLELRIAPTNEIFQFHRFLQI